MKKTFAVAAGLAAAITMSLAYAQAGGGYGRGMGMGMGTGPGCDPAAQAGAGCLGGGYGPGDGSGIGYGHGHGPGAAGMTLLTPEERRAFHTAMHGVTSIDACNALVAQRQELIATRAKELGVAVPAAPRGDMCERMKAHGRFG